MKSSRLTRCKKPGKIQSSELLKIYKILHGFFGHQRWWPGDTSFEVMLGAILTQNTAWTNVEKAIANIKHAKKLSFKALRHLPERKIAQLIRPAGYFNIKADRLKHFLRFLAQECKGDIRRLQRQSLSVLREKLLEVKGIGPETADSILLYALRKPSFVIDSYTKRIFSRHGLASFDDDYGVWQKIFAMALPFKLDLYNDYHAQIVHVGKKFCRKIPRCELCPLGNWTGKTVKISLDNVVK